MSQQLERPSTRAWCIFIVLQLYTTLQFVTQVSTGVMVSNLMQDFNVDALGVSLLSSSFFYTYVLFQVPAGVLIDLYGLRRTLSTAASILALGCCLFALSQTLWVAILAKIIMGIGAAFGFVGLLYILNGWFPDRYFPLLLAVAETVGMLGTAAFNTMMGSFVVHYGWRFPIVGCAAAAATLGVLIGLSIPRDGHPKATGSKHEVQTKEEVKDNLRKMIKLPQVWLCGLFGMMMFSSITVFTSLWGVPFLKAVHLLDHETATFAVSMVPLGLGMFSPFVGWALRHLNPNLLMGVGSCISLAFSILLGNSQLSASYLYLSLLVVGGCGSIYLASYTISKSHVSKKMQGTTMAFVNMLIMLGGPLIQPIIGTILSMRQGEGVLDNYEVYSSAGYLNALAVFPVAFAIAVLVSFFIKTKVTSKES